MAKEVVWTKIILETFLEESGILFRIWQQKHQLYTRAIC